MSAQFAPIKGAPPSIEWVAVDALHVDESYQRSLDAVGSLPLITAIARQWDWRLCAPLVVARRDEGLFIVDGQHRHAAALKRGDIPHLPAIISRFDSIADEARCFVSVNTICKRIAPLDAFRAALASDDQTALLVASMIADAGLLVAPHSNHTAWKPMQISCVGGIKAALSRHGRAVVSAALVNIAEAFEGDVMQYAGRLLAGLYLLHAEGGIDPDVLVEALQEDDQEGWVQRMRARVAQSGESNAVAMKEAIRAQHDKMAIANQEAA